MKKASVVSSTKCNTRVIRRRHEDYDLEAVPARSIEKRRSYNDTEQLPTIVYIFATVIRYMRFISHDLASTPLLRSFFPHVLVQH